MELKHKKTKKIVNSLILTSRRLKKNKESTLSKSVMNTHLSEPWFSLIATGLKTVEGRINKGKFAALSVGDIITFNNDDFKHREISIKVNRITKYKDFKSYLQTETLTHTVPGQPTIEHGLEVYYKYYTVEQEREFGIIAIGFDVI